jgi:3'-phosphoadenosine 5'-phosphosulfate sulfotransferase (PAPS reductase)/FAD synthetase
MMKHTASAIIQLQSLPLEYQVYRSERLIHEAMQHFNYKMAVSFSGGKDSTVLLHLVRKLYPDVPAVFVNTGLEYPEIVKFVRATENVVWLRPKMRFKDVLEKYGYPVISKEVSQWLFQIATTRSDKLHHKRMDQLAAKWKFMIEAPFKISNRCCDIMKKGPFHAYTKETGNAPLIGTMAKDSAFRMESVMEHGCNAFDINNPQSRPLAMWTEGHVWEYLRTYNVPYSTIYDMGYHRTGCMFCMFGLHMESYPNRFERMRETHPKLYRYCMEDLGLQKVMEWYPKRGYMPQERMFA